MKKENHIYGVFFAFILLTSTLYASCHRDLDTLPPRRSTENLLEEVRNFLQQKISPGAYAQINWAASSIYYLKNEVAAMRLPLHYKNDTTDYLLLGSTGIGRWEGNYVHIAKENNGPLLHEGSLTRTSLDSTRNNTFYFGPKYKAAGNRLLVMEGEPLTVPNTVWMGLVYAMQTAFPEAFNNWYYPANPAPMGYGGGPVPTLYFDPYIADNVIVDTSITNNFPCVKNIIDTLAKFGNLNQRAQVALHEIFNVGKKIKLTIKLDWDLVGTTTDGYAKATSIVPSDTLTEPIDFKATIFLNPAVLRTATKEYIAATLIHEAVHSYIEFKWWQYRYGNIDSTTFKSLFPIVYLRMMPNSNLFYLPSANEQHNAMAESYFTTMASALYAIHNDSMTIQMKDSIYKALAWGGLHTTNAWRGFYTDTCKIKAINAAARDTTSPMPFVLIGPRAGICRDTFNFNYKTLKLQKQCD
jgi:hypothetical protein